MGFNEPLFRYLIAKKGKSIDDAAVVMGINKATLYRKINGKSEFLRDEIQKFCIAFADSEINPMNIFFASKVS